MRTILVIKEKEHRSLRTVDKLLERGEDVALILMLDAVYMATATDENAALKDMMGQGARAFLLKGDVERRGLEKRLLPGVELVDYEGLIELLFSEDQRVLNL